VCARAPEEVSLVDSYSSTGFRNIPTREPPVLLVASARGLCLYVGKER
jgi:hypothetical protein